MTGAGSGFVNAHTHLYSGLAPLGMPAPDPAPKSFTEILERVWWRLDRALDEEALRVGARLYVAESLLHGTTGLIDHHESPEFIEGSLDVLADVCQELGMPAVLCYGVTERNDGAEEARRGLTECARFFASNSRPLVRTAFGVHASFTVSDDTLRELGVVAREIGARVHLHVAEDRADVDDARERGYDGVIARLLATDALPPGSILAHGVHLDAAEVEACAERDLWLVQNPRSNRGNGVGYPAALAGPAAAGRVALGTDGFASDMLAEADALASDAATHGEDVPSALRRLDVGHALLADCFGVGPPLDVRVGLGRIVVNGRDVVQDGVLRTADIDEIRARATEQAPRVWRRMAEL